MTTYTAQSANLQQEGLELDVQVGIWTSAVDAITRAGGTPPALVPIRVQVDTGATGTSVEPWVIQKLGLPPVGTAPVLTPNSPDPVDCPMYAIKLVVPGLALNWETIVLALPLQGQAIQGLIGRDLLSHCVLVYTGQSGSWSLSL